MTMKNESGQVALIVLLLLTISLTIGLSLIARTVNELRATSNAEKSAQAYAAAEAGIEEAILKQESITTGTSGNVSLGGSKNASYTITDTAVQGDSPEPFIFPNQVEKDEAVQLWLFNYDRFIDGQLSFMSYADGHSFRVYWGSPEKMSNENNYTIPAVEVTMITAVPSGQNLTSFGLDKRAFDPIADASNPSNLSQKRGRSVNNFSAPVSGGPYTVEGTRFQYAADIPLPTGTREPLLLRIKPLYNQQKHGIAVDPNPNGSSTVALPAQGSIVDSEGASGNVVRKLRVYQSYPTLPGIFDFALFNGSSNPLQKE